MKQLNLFPENSIPKTTLIVDTNPKNIYKKSLINIGLSYAANELNADTTTWWQKINAKKYTTIGFNVVYHNHVANITPFLKLNGIPPLVSSREGEMKMRGKVYKTPHPTNLYAPPHPYLIAGGKGVSNLNGALDDIVDEIYYGEIDGESIDSRGWTYQSPLNSPPVIEHGRAVIEVTRGCKYRCGFCEYAWVMSGKYREKDIRLVRKQIQHCVDHGVRRITLRSANLAGYSELDTLMELCLQHNIYQGWSNHCVLDSERIAPWMPRLRITAPMIGVESFDETTRAYIGGGKQFSDEKLHETITNLLTHGASRVRIYLIYGIPGDNYERWYAWVKELASIRAAFKHIVRFNFSITNLNPCAGTPFENAPWVDFQKKAEFLLGWIAACKEAGLYAKDWDVKPGNDYGYLGQQQHVYDMTMRLRTEGAAWCTPRLLECPGIRRSIGEKKAQRFVEG